MKALFKGIYDKYLTVNDFRTALTGGLYLQNAPQNNSLPYGVYWQISDTTDFNFSSLFDIYAIQFDLIEDESGGYDSIGDLYDKCIALFDDCTLTVTGYQFLGMERQADYLIKDDDQDVWQYSIEYEIWLRKTL
jgi:hypothetical protein